MALGDQLREARQARKRTPSQIAAATRMKVQIVEAIEREDFSRIAAPIYGKGFIKLFAEEVGLDPAPLIQEYVDCFVNSDGKPSLSNAAISRGANGKRDAQEARRAKTKSIGDREVTEIVPEPTELEPEPEAPEPAPPEPAAALPDEPVSVPAGEATAPLDRSPAPQQADLFSEPAPVEEPPSRSDDFFNPETRPRQDPSEEVRTEPPPANSFSFFEEPEPLPPEPVASVSSPPSGPGEVIEPPGPAPDLPTASEPEAHVATPAASEPEPEPEPEPEEPPATAEDTPAAPSLTAAIAASVSEPPHPEPEAEPQEEAPSAPEPDVEPEPAVAPEAEEIEPAVAPEAEAAEAPQQPEPQAPEVAAEPGPVGAAPDFIPLTGPDSDSDGEADSADSLADLEREFKVEDGDVVSRLLESDDPSVLADEEGAARKARLKAGWRKVVQESVQPCVDLWRKCVQSITEKRRLAKAWHAEKEFDRSTRPPSPYGSMVMMLTGAFGTILVLVLLITCIARCSRQEDPAPVEGGEAGDMQIALEPPSPYMD